jgi:hypothetical protein
MGDYAYLVQMDIPGDWEDEFNRVYDTEHAKYLCNAAGVESCTRYLLESTDASKIARYAALYEMDAPDTPQSEGWRVEGEKGDWATRIRPHTTNRTHTVLRRIAAETGGPPASAGYVFLVQTDIPVDAEDEFNHLYDTVHLPGLRKVHGVRNAYRYRMESTNADGFAKYVALYEIDNPDVIDSEPWKAAVQDEWTAKVRHKCIGLTRTIMKRVARHPN